MAQERKKKGKSVDVPADLISDLPRGVQDAIMECLPLRDAARMSVLSHKWLEIWTSIPQLTFDASFFHRVLKDKVLNTNRFSRVVSKVLFHHEGRLVRFHLYVPPLKSCPDVNQWICYLSRTGVSDLSLQNQHEVPLRLSSQHLFSFVNLEKLKLHHCIINPPPSFQGFRKLTCLELHRITLQEKAFQRLIVSCPLLQKLRVTNFVGMEHIIIEAPLLSHLIVDGTFVSLDVKNAANLVSAFVGLQQWMKVRHKANLHVLMQSLASSSTIEKLSFKGQFCKVLFKESLLPTAILKLRILDLCIQLNDLDDFCSVISTIQKCPNIEKLDISVSSSKHLSSDVLDYDPHCLLHRLCCADVRIFSGCSMELKLIEFLLGCSPVLEKLSIASIGHIQKTFRSKMAVQLIRFRRASQKVQVICPEPVFADDFDITYSDSSLSSSEDSSSTDSD